MSRCTASRTLAPGRIVIVGWTLIHVADGLEGAGVTHIPPPVDAEENSWRLWVRHRAAVATNFLDVGKSAVLVLPTGAGDDSDERPSKVISEHSRRRLSDPVDMDGMKPNAKLSGGGHDARRPSAHGCPPICMSADHHQTRVPARGGRVD